MEYNMRFEHTVIQYTMIGSVYTSTIHYAMKFVNKRKHWWCYLVIQESFRNENNSLMQM